MVVAAVVAVLGGAGVAGAVVEGNVTFIKPGQYARLGTTDVYCQSFVDSGTHKPAFDCGAFGPNYHVGGSYSAIFDQGGVTVDQWDATGRHAHAVLTRLNP